MAESNVFTLDSGYLARKKKQILQDIRWAEYKVGSTWHRAEIEEATILADGRVEILFIIDHTVSGNITVTGVRLYDRNGEMIGSKTTSITRLDATEGISYTIRFRLFQAIDADGNGDYNAL